MERPNSGPALRSSMKLYATIAIHVRGEEVMRNPRFLEKVKQAFGGRPDLRSGRMRAWIEAAAVVDGVRDAMRRIGASNAVSLVVDDTVLFHDPHAKPDDLGDLFLAFHDNASVFGSGFDELRLAFEHREGDLHVVAEVQARSEHARGEPAVRVVVSGRIDAFTPRPSEDAEAFRRRAEPIASDRKALEMYRLQFTTFVERLREALASALPTARVEIEVAEPRVVRPGPEARKPPDPRAREYDPYDAYYPNPMGMMANMFLWSALFSMAMPMHLPVVDAANRFQGHTDDPGIENGATSGDATSGADEASSGEEASSSDEASSGSWWEGDQGASADTASADTGGGWWDSVFGGDGDGGDFGGGDFGGDE